MLINSIQPAYLPQQNSKTTNTINTEKEKENCFQWWQTHKQLTELDAISFSASVYKVSDKLTARLRTFIAWTVTQAASRIQHARDQTRDERTSTKPTTYQRQQATKHSLYSVNSSVDHLNVGEVPEPSKMVCSSLQKKTATTVPHTQPFVFYYCMHYKCMYECMYCIKAEGYSSMHWSKQWPGLINSSSTLQNSEGRGNYEGRGNHGHTGWQHVQTLIGSRSY